MDYFKPDYYFKHFTSIKVEWLKDNNIQCILSDIDSTLAGHNCESEGELSNWLSELDKNNIKLICVSNNNESRVSAFCKQNHLEGAWKCKKPAIKVIDSLLERQNIDKTKTVIMGDQLFTDMWCGKNLGIRTILVKPIGNHQPINIRFKRLIEKKMMKKWILSEEEQ